MHATSINSRLFDIRAGGHRLRAKSIIPSSGEDKQKPALVFLHDAIGSIEQWRGFPEDLVARTRCPGLVYERLGYGSSEARVEARTSEYLEVEALESLPEVLRNCETRDVILIGHSDGGSIALVFAGSCPPDIRLRGVITEAAHVFVEEITLEGIRQATQPSKLIELKTKLAKFHGDQAESVVEEWYKTWLSPSFKDWNLEKYLSSIHCPCLVIQGENDEYGTRAQVDAIARQITGPSKTLMISDCAHVPHYQAKEEVLKAMENFIEHRN